MADLVALALQRRLAEAEANGDEVRAALYRGRLEDREAQADAAEQTEEGAPEATPRKRTAPKARGGKGAKPKRAEAKAAPAKTPRKRSAPKPKAVDTPPTDTPEKEI